MQLVFEHEFPCSPSEFWAMFLNPEFSREFWVGKTGASTYELLVDETSPGGDRRRAHRVVLGGLELPAPIAKLLGGPLGFTEEGTFHASWGHYAYRQIYSILTDRIDVNGNIAVRRSADGQSVTRVVNVTVNVKIFGLGGLAERAAESNLKWGFDAEAEFGAEWLKMHQTAPPSAVRGAGDLRVAR